MFVITDPYGHRIGGDAGMGTELVFNEIAGGGCSLDALDNDEEEGEPSPQSLHCNINGVIAGTYTVTLYGRGEVRYGLYFGGIDSKGVPISSATELFGYIVHGATLTYSVTYDPLSTQGITGITKTVSLSSLGQDIKTATSLGQLGNAKFAASLTKQVDLAMTLVDVCNKHKATKANGCKLVVDVLRLFVKRLELANQKCDTAGGCDEGPELAAFEKAHRGDRDYDDFFRAWDKDDWHKWKKTSKRFVTDEALAIIRGDAEALIKTLEPSPKEPRRH